MPTSAEWVSDQHGPARMSVAMARLELLVQSVPSADGPLSTRVWRRERDCAPVRLLSLAWEQPVPANEPHPAGPRRGGLDATGIASAFGTSTLGAGGHLTSSPIVLGIMSRRGTPFIIKAIGTDANVHRLAAWADLLCTSPARPEDVTSPTPVEPGWGRVPLRDGLNLGVMSCGPPPL